MTAKTCCFIMQHRLSLYSGHLISVVCSTKVLCPQSLFSGKSQRYKSHNPTMWTYNICAFDTGMYYDYYWQNHDILQRCKQNKRCCLITGNKYSPLHERSNVGLGIKSMAGLKTFVQEWNGHNAFAHSSLMNCFNKSFSLSV